MTTFKDFIGAKDFKLWDGILRTFSRRTSTGGSFTQNKVGHMVDVLEVYGSGTDYNANTINTAIGAIGSSSCALLLQPGTWTIDADVTLPANITLYVPKGAVLAVSTGVTLTINSTIQAGSYQIFSGVGTIAGTLKMVFKDPSWFSGTETDSTAPTYQALTIGGAFSIDTISERTSAAGVTIDGVKLKDSEPYCDVINEKTGAAGVTIDGVKLKDSEPYCNVINEKTGGSGVTVDGLLIKDGSWTRSSFSVTMSGNQTLVGTAKVAFDTETFDTNNNFDSGNYRFLPTVAGKYILTVTIAAGTATNLTGLYIYLYKNGSISKYGTTWNGTYPGVQIVKTATFLVDANGSSDYFEIYGLHEGTGSYISSASTLYGVRVE